MYDYLSVSCREALDAMYSEKPAQDRERFYQRLTVDEWVALSFQPQVVQMRYAIAAYNEGDGQQSWIHLFHAFDR